MRETYGVVLPGMDISNLAGKLIVIEGTDGVGRSTQINLLRPWLEQEGHAVLVTGMTRSNLAGKGIKRAKEGNTLGRVTSTLFYAADFADRLENEIEPALRAGFVVLTDRYIYSLMARALVRQLETQWTHKLYSFALKPDAVFYLRVSLDSLLPRVVFSRGFDYWESGVDMYASDDLYDNFCKYQTALLNQFDKLTEEYKFDVIDATASPDQIFKQLQRGVRRVLNSGGAAANIHVRKPAAEAPQPSPCAEEPRGS